MTENPSGVEALAIRPKTVNKYFEVPLDTNKNYVERFNVTNSLERLLPVGSDSPQATKRRVVLYGLGGSGKTEIAVRFAELHRNDYMAVFWVNGMDDTHLSEGFQRTARVLGISDVRTPQLSVSNVQSWLSTERGWLLIVDNLDEDVAMDVLQREYLNAGMTGDILITSRNPKAAARWQSVEVSDMEPQEAKVLLTNIVGSQIADCVDVVGLLEDLGHLALAIDQAASFILETAVSVRRYRDLFLTERRRLLEYYPSTQYNQESRHNVMTTWELCFKRLEEDDVPASKLLLTLSLLHHDDIPLRLLESASNGQYYWAPNGEFEILPEGKGWIPGDLTCIFNDQFRLLQAIAALRKFSLVRHQTHHENDSMMLRLHPLVHYWASQRLEKAPEVQRQLMICTIGLVSGSFTKQDLLPPMTTLKLSARTLDDRSLGTWPWRQYPSLIPHALRSLQHSKALSTMPESVAYRSLSLLQVLEYSGFDSFTHDQEFALSLIDHLEIFQKASDRYLQYACMIWRLTRANSCFCRKQQDEHSMPLCSVCKSATNSATSLLHTRYIFSRKSARVRVATRSIEAILQNSYLPECTFSVRRPSSWMEKYEVATRQYLKIRFSSEDRYFFDIPVTETAEVASTFKSLCGETSEEYRRSQFYATGSLLSSGKWKEVELGLKPLVELSIERPVHSWSHERCIIRFKEALLQQGKDEEVRQIMSRINEAYRATGKQLRTVESVKPLKGDMDAVSYLCTSPYVPAL